MSAFLQQNFSASLLVSALLLFVSSFSLTQAQTVRTIAVTGVAERQLAPDAFSMSFTFEQKGQDLVSVKSDVDKAVEQATSLLINNKVSEKNIRSMDVTVYPWIETEQRERLNKGFVYRRTVFFTHEDIDAYDMLIKQVAALKPQQIGQLLLINQNTDAVQRELLKEALKDAQSKAQEMALVLNTEVGHVLFMSDGTQPPENMLDQRSGTMLMAEARSTNASLPGENTISAKVEVVFEIHTISSRPQ